MGIWYERWIRKGLESVAADFKISQHMLGGEGDQNILSCVWVTIDGGVDCWINLLTTYTHDSELHAIMAAPLISTIHKLLQHPLSVFAAFCDFICRSLATAYNNGDCLSSCPQVLSSQLPLQNYTKKVFNSDQRSKALAQILRPADKKSTSQLFTFSLHKALPFSDVPLRGLGSTA
jgi:hypothetical protein